jgi:polyhydroxyalkanoate synthesis regulator phasin
MKKLQDSIQEAVQKAWAEAVSRLHGVESQVGQRVRQALDHAGGRTEDAQRLLTDLGRKLQQNSEAVGQRIEESVKAVYSKVRDPLAKELTTLRTRADQLSQRIESQLRRPKGGTEDAAPAPPAPAEPAGGDESK